MVEMEIDGGRSFFVARKWRFLVRVIRVWFLVPVPVYLCLYLYLYLFISSCLGFISSLVEHAYTRPHTHTTIASKNARRTRVSL